MSFLEKLRIVNEEPSRTNRMSIFDNSIPGGMRHCEWLVINDDYALSIQASEFHHCIPRGLVPLDKYTHFEMALIFKGHLTTDVSSIRKFNRFDELMEYHDDCIFSEVPKDLIEDLYIWWLKLYSKEV